MLKVGDRVVDFRGKQGVIIDTYLGWHGEHRYEFKADNGLVHIFSEEDLTFVRHANIFERIGMFIRKKALA